MHDAGDLFGVCGQREAEEALEVDAGIVPGVAPAARRESAQECISKQTGDLELGEEDGLLGSGGEEGYRLRYGVWEGDCETNDGRKDEVEEMRAGLGIHSRNVRLQRREM